MFIACWRLRVVRCLVFSCVDCVFALFVVILFECCLLSVICCAFTGCLLFVCRMLIILCCSSVDCCCNFFLFVVRCLLCVVSCSPFVVCLYV